MPFVLLNTGWERIKNYEAMEPPSDRGWANELINKLQQGESNMELGFQYIIGTRDKKTQEMSIAPHPYIHTTYNSADVEADELAKRLPGKQIVILVVEDVREATEPVSPPVRKLSGL